MRVAGLLALLLVTACHDEPDFDERYDKASRDIRAKADAIDAQLERHEKMGGTDNSGQAAAKRTDGPEPSE